MRRGIVLAVALASTFVVELVMSSVASAATTIVYVGNADTQDISVFELGAGGVLAARGTTVLQSPAQPGRSVQLAASPDRRFLYAAYLSDPAHSSAATLAIDPRSGRLTLSGAKELPDTMAYLATDRTGRFLFGASYGGNKVTINPIGANGVVGDAVQVLATLPKAHAIIPDPSNRYVFHTALGGDVVYQQKFDAHSGQLTANEPATVAVAANAGPRFLTFAPDGRFLYVVNELDGGIEVFPLDAQSGRLQPAVQLASTLPPGFAGKPWAADIRLTPDGRFLYASERTSSTLAAFRVDPQTGRLEAIGSFPTVKQPRAFAIDPSGKYLLSSGQLSNSVTVHAIDPKSGQLAPLADYPTGKNPTWVEALRLP